MFDGKRQHRRQIKLVARSACWRMSASLNAAHLTPSSPSPAPARPFGFSEVANRLIHR
jgi:hypothetical protein